MGTAARGGVGQRKHPSYVLKTSMKSACGEWTVVMREDKESGTAVVTPRAMKVVWPECWQ